MNTGSEIHPKGYALQYNWEMEDLLHKSDCAHHHEDSHVTGTESELGGLLMYSWQLRSVFLSIPHVPPSIVLVHEVSAPRAGLECGLEVTMLHPLRGTDLPPSKTK